MKEIIEKGLKGDIFSDDYEYFFSFLTDRFELATDLWAKELEKKFNKRFKPIWILSAKQNQKFLRYKDNYIVINKKLQSIKEKLSNNGVIYLQDYEDLNKEFSESGFIKELIEKIMKKQDRIFVLGFTSSCLKIDNEKIIILGPNPEIATKFDNKIEHIKLFNQLNISRNNNKIYNSIQEVKEKEEYPYFISAAYTSGGHESDIIYQEEDLDAFYSKLRKINKYSKFLVANLIRDIASSPNINAIVTDKGNTEIICITDQILRKNEYLGNIYPSKIDRNKKEAIIQITKIIGNYLSEIGFKGLFGLDFIIDSKGNIFTVDLNPRRQGGYLCNLLMSKKVNIIELELALALGEKIPKINYEDFQVDYYWAHSKIKPYYPNTRIKDNYREGEYDLPFNQIGSMFKCLFYPLDYLFTGGNAGYFIVSGDTYEDVKKRTIKETEIIISTDFELYEGL